VVWSILIVRLSRAAPRHRRALGGHLRTVVAVSVSPDVWAVRHPGLLTGRSGMRTLWRSEATVTSSPVNRRRPRAERGNAAPRLRRAIGSTMHRLGSRTVTALTARGCPWAAAVQGTPREANLSQRPRFDADCHNSSKERHRTPGSRFRSGPDREMPRTLRLRPNPLPSRHFVPAICSTDPAALRFPASALKMSFN
jgi:hypothetical protein